MSAVGLRDFGTAGCRVPRVLASACLLALFATPVGAQDRQTDWVASPSRPGVSASRWYDGFGRTAEEWQAWAEGFGGRLASFVTLDEEFLMGAATVQSACCIGLSRASLQDPWVWASGDPLGYSLPDTDFSGDLPQSVRVFPFNGIRKYVDLPDGQVHFRAIIEVMDFRDCDGNGEFDDYEEILLGQPPIVCPNLGAVYCSGTPNSTGMIGRSFVNGHLDLALDEVRLMATQLPVGTFGYWLMSMVQGNVPLPGGSQGVLCLGFPIVRFNIPPFGPVFVDSTGVDTLDLPLQALPQGVLFQPGQSWNFQFWHRDLVQGQLTSNTTEATAVTFQ